MKKLSKKIIALLLVVAMLVPTGALSFTTSAAGGYDVKIEMDLNDLESKWSVASIVMIDAPIILTAYDNNGNQIAKTSASNTANNVTWENIDYPSTIEFNFEYLEEGAFTWPLDDLGGIPSIPVTVYIKAHGASNYTKVQSFTINSSNIDSVYSGALDLADDLGMLPMYGGITVDAFMATYEAKIGKVHLTTEIYPAGYDFKEDSYNFENGTTTISEKYFTTLFGTEQGKLLYKKKKNAGGVCFGMAYTTAAFYEGIPSCDYVRGLSTKSNISIGNKTMSVYDYIVYSYIYQFSSSTRAMVRPQSCTISGSEIYETIKNCISNNVLVPITMWYCKEKKDGFEVTAGHAVLAVGIEGNTVLVDDPNNKEDYEYIEFDSDGEWTFSGRKNTNSENSLMIYSLDVQRPYQLLSSGTTTTVHSDLIDSNDVSSGMITETYVEGMEKLDTDKLLMFVDSTSYKVSNENLIEVYDDIGTTQTSESDPENLYWICDDKTVTISEIDGDNNEIIVAGNDVSIGVKTQDKSDVTITVNEETNDISAKIVGTKGNEYEINFETTDASENDVIITLQGAANSENISATQTDTGISVTGISDGTVTLSKDDKIIETQEFDNAVGEIEITYDIEGESDEVELDYHKHSYTSETTKTATCSVAGEITFTCSCNDTYTETVEINRDNHIGETEIRNAAEATCTKKGYSGDTYCVDCQQKISAGAETDPLGHSDLNSDNLCDACGEAVNEPAPCTCMCHSDAFSRFIHTILCFFYKLFGMNQYQFCACGKAHW